MFNQNCNANFPNIASRASTPFIHHKLFFDMRLHLKDQFLGFEALVDNLSVITGGGQWVYICKTV